MYTKKQHDLRIQQAQDPYGVALLQKRQLEICRQQLDSALKDAEKIKWRGYKEAAEFVAALKESLA